MTLKIRSRSSKSNQPLQPSKKCIYAICCWLLLQLWDSIFVLCFVVRYFVSILVLQSSWWGRKSWLLCFVCLPGSRNCCVALAHNVTGLSAVCDCGISWSYPLFLVKIYPLVQKITHKNKVKRTPTSMASAPKKKVPHYQRHNKESYKGIAL